MDSESWGPVTATPSERRRLRRNGAMLLVIAVVLWLLHPVLAGQWDGYSPLRSIAYVLGLVGAFVLLLGIVASPHSTDDADCVD